MAHTYHVDVTRDGHWWMVHIPEIDGLTQARSVDEVEYMARDYIAVSQGCDIADVAVKIAS